MRVDVEGITANSRGLSPRRKRYPRFQPWKGRSRWLPSDKTDPTSESSSRCAAAVVVLKAALIDLPTVADARRQKTRDAVVKARADEAIARATPELNTWIKSHGWTAAGAAMLAFYDPLWTPEFLRRNEVLIRVEP